MQKHLRASTKNNSTFVFLLLLWFFFSRVEVSQESGRKEQKRRMHGQHARKLFHGSAAAASACSISSNAASSAASAGSYPPPSLLKPGFSATWNGGRGRPASHRRLFGLLAAEARGSLASRPRRLGLRAFCIVKHICFGLAEARGGPGRLSTL